MFAVVDVPPLASAFSVLVVPLLAGLAEPVAYLGVVLQRLERRLGRALLAATVVVVHLGRRARLLSAAGPRQRPGRALAAYRVRSVLPFLAIWTALISPWARGCRSWRPDGSSTVAPRLS